MPIETQEKPMPLVEEQMPASAPVTTETKTVSKTAVLLAVVGILLIAGSAAAGILAMRRPARPIPPIIPRPAGYLPGYMPGYTPGYMPGGTTPGYGYTPGYGMPGYVPGYR